MYTTSRKVLLAFTLLFLAQTSNAQGASEALYDVMDPRGELPDIQLVPLSPRLESLEGKTIHVIHSWPQGGGFDFVLDYFDEQIAARFPGASLVHKTRNETYSTDDPALWEDMLEHADAFIYVGAPSSSTTHYAVKFASMLEGRGLPGMVLMFDTLVSVRDSTLERQGTRTRVVEVPYPSDSMSSTQLATTFEATLAALTAPLTEGETQTGVVSPPPRSRSLMRGTLAEVQDYFYENGLTDGLPIIPPTQSAVAAMLAGTSHAADEVVMEAMVPEGLRVTVEAVAINAVMAGCKPEHMPVLLATLEAMANYEQLASLNSIVRSTNSFGFMQVVNGPIRHEIGMKSDTDLLGHGNRANSTIGRALRLFLVNLGGGVPGTNMMAVIGSMATRPFAFAEFEEASPWESLSVSRGFDEEASTLTFFMGGLSHAGNYGHVDFGLEHVAADIAQFELAGGATVIVSPKRAEILADAGMSKQDVIDFLYDHATLTLEELRGSRYFRERDDTRNLPDSARARVYNEGTLNIVVAGGDASPMMQAWEMYRPVTVSIDKWR